MQNGIPFVGVDAHIDPAIRNRKIARIFGETVKRPVGADASVRPWAMTNLPQRFVKNGCALCGSMWASTPTNGVRDRIGAFIFAGAYRRADRVVRPYGCIPFRIGARKFAVFSAGRGKPRPYVTANKKDVPFGTSFLL